MLKKIVKIRSCIVCRRKDLQENLLRFIIKNNEFIIDPLKKNKGRGFYICSSSVCGIKFCEKKKMFRNVIKSNIKQITYESFRQHVILGLLSEVELIINNSGIKQNKLKDIVIKLKQLRDMIQLIDFKNYFNDFIWNILELSEFSCKQYKLLNRFNTYILNIY